ncbi:MAG: hypothetical protein JSU68_09045 [Phycisphaerales bacterium]|nr:MAG: hypothetical protein JSU68_09045 [Phycisphaerales bacterium]
MSIEVVCEQCGTVLRAPDDAAGRVGRCKSCGQRMRVPTRRQQAEREAREVDPWFGTQRRAEEFGAVQQPVRGFWSDAARSFVLGGKAVNLIALVMTWILLVVFWLLGFAAYGGMFGMLLMLLGRFFVAGWLCAYLINVITETAGGEDEMPAWEMAADKWEGIVVPFFSFALSLLGVLLPAIVCSIAANVTGSEPLAYVAVGLALAGVFAWPAALLVVSIGGVSAAFQLDAIVLTIVRSFLPYVAVVGLIVLTVGGQGWAASKLAEGEKTFGQMAGVIAVQQLLMAWAILVTMRCIGLYYRHFKNRFPWSAE